MSQQSFVDGAYRTFSEEVAGALTGKEGYAVEQVPGTGNIQLYNAGTPIGVVHQKMQGGTDVVVRMYGKGGTMKVIQDATATAIGAKVKPMTGGKHRGTVTAGDRTVGIRISPGGPGADGDFMEIIDVIEKI